MSPRALTAPPDDRSMWRRLVARAHPDTGGSEELFVWANHVRTVLCGGELGPEIPRREASTDDVARIPFDPSIDFSELTRRALKLAEEVGDGYGALLELLSDCEPPPMQKTGAWALRGASYKRLAAIGHSVGMSKAERGEWYRIAEAVPLSDRHAGHILGRLKRMAA